MAKAKKNKVGRPKIIPDIKRVESLAALGLTQMQIADALGICNDTLIERKKEFPEFVEAIKRGQNKGIAEVTNALFRNATKNDNLGAQVFYLKNRAGWKDKTETEVSGKDGKPIEHDLVAKVSVEVIDNRINTLIGK